MSVSARNRAILAASVLGILVSTYALFVELKLEADSSYKALCDLHEKVSCSKVLTSEYSKGFGVLPTSIPNPVFGVVYYCAIILLNTFENLLAVRFQFLLSLLAIGCSCYLAALLIFVIKDICVVCIASYIINAVLLYYIYKRMKAISLKCK